MTGEAPELLGHIPSTWRVTVTNRRLGFVKDLTVAARDEFTACAMAQHLLGNPDSSGITYSAKVVSNA